MSTSAPTSAPAHASTPARKSSVDWRDYIIYIGLVLVYGICVLFLYDSGFATVENLLNIFRQTAMIALTSMFHGAGERGGSASLPVLRC